MKRKRKLIIILIIFVVLSLLVTQAGNFLVVSDTPQKSDIIIILSGDKGERMEEGARLFHEGYADKILVSGGVIYNNVTAASLIKLHAMDLKIDEDKILTEDKADSTYENALFCKSILKEHNYRSAIIVTSNYHTRRTKMIFERVYKILV